MSAPASLAAASAVAVSLLFTAVPAFAADLWEPPRGGAAYDDSRYGDRYGDRNGEAYDDEAAPPEDRYAGHPEDFGPPLPRGGLKGEGYYPPYERRYGDNCVPREIVRDRLRAAGWYDFRDLEPRGEVVLAEARSPTGRLFDLTIERCSGEIVDARPLDGGRDYARDYAYGGRRYWPRPY